jgi:hypothetical protein
MIPGDVAPTPPRITALFALGKAWPGPGVGVLAAVLLVLGAAGDRAAAQEVAPPTAPAVQGDAAPPDAGGSATTPVKADADAPETAPSQSGKEPARVASLTAPAEPAAPATPAAAAPASAAPASDGVRFRWSGSGEFLLWSRLSGSMRQPIFVDHSSNTDIEATHFHPKLTATLGRNALAYGEICLTHPSVGVQPEQAWFEYNVNDRANIQFGRILIPFGQWNQIHDVYDHKSISYPLMYLGHEETDLELDGGPTPIVSTGFTDLGLLFFGSVWPSKTDQLWYGAYVCNGRFGFGNDIEWLDLWNEVKDNNSDKAFGGRLVYTLHGNLSLGLSYQTGKWDPQNHLRYQLEGVDLYYRFRDRVNLRAEYTRSPIETTAQDYTKEGWWVQVDFPISKEMEFVATASGLSRTHAERISNLWRYTVGVNRNLTSSLKLKTELEFLSLGSFVGNPANPDAVALGTSFDDTTRIKASLVAVF